jgi:hypothetical protein
VLNLQLSSQVHTFAGTGVKTPKGRDKKSTCAFTKIKIHCKNSGCRAHFARLLLTTLIYLVGDQGVYESIESFLLTVPFSGATLTEVLLFNKASR